jgi:hypothetical protein
MEETMLREAVPPHMGQSTLLVSDGDSGLAGAHAVSPRSGRRRRRIGAFGLRSFMDFE